MQGIEQIFDLEKATIGQCEEIAKKIGFDSTTFDLCGPKGKLKAKWIDAHFGMFEVEGHVGFLMSSQFELSPDVWCENIQKDENAN